MTRKYGVICSVCEFVGITIKEFEEHSCENFEPIDKNPTNKTTENCKECPCGKKAKKYEIVICKSCISGVTDFGFKLKEIKNGK